jgi:hypothetical protein
MTWTLPEYTVAAAGILYAITGCGMAYQHKWGLAIVYFAYGLSNVGLIIASLETVKG